jgi:hypothetical protein
VRCEKFGIFTVVAVKAQRRNSSWVQLHMRIVTVAAILNCRFVRGREFEVLLDIPMAAEAEGRRALNQRAFPLLEVGDVAGKTILFGDNRM